MQRRQLLKLPLAATASLYAKTAVSALNCQPTPNPVFQECRAGLDSSIAQITARKQLANQWCWAACIEMVFAYHGFYLDQQAIVASTWGAVVNMPASDMQIMRDLNSSWTDKTGRQFQTISQVVPSGMAAQELANGFPLIVCTQGHAMVLTSLAYQLNTYSGQGQDREAVVRDPWQNRGRRVLSATEWFGRNLLLAIRCM